MSHPSLARSPQLEPDEECRLCRELAGLAEGNLANELTDGALADTHIHTSGDLTTIVPLGPLTEGHVLIVPKQHFLSFRQLSAAQRRAADQYVQLIAGAVESWGPVIAFEHGADVSRCAVGQCLDHAHLHLVPIAIDLAPAVAAHFKSRRVCSLEALDTAVPAGTSYLLCRSMQGDWTVFWIGEALPSQYLRMLVHRLAHREGDWDWRANIRADQMLATRERLRAALGTSR